MQDTAENGQKAQAAATKVARSSTVSAPLLPSAEGWEQASFLHNAPMPAPAFLRGQASLYNTATLPAVSLRGLTKRYGAMVAVNGLDLTIQAGEVFGFLGPNGAGKTTTIQMICGLLAPDGGEIKIFGASLAKLPLARTRIGVCPQHLVIWEKLTPLEQLVFLASMYDIPEMVAHDRALGMLEALGLYEKRDTLAKHLSGGMKRRLNLAMALIHEPAILILDEPEAGLDPQSRVLVREYIRRWVRESEGTVILTSHNIDEVERMADRVAIIDGGRLLALDTPEALKKQLHGGDLLEVELADAAHPHLEEALFILQQMTTEASLEGSFLSLRMPALTEHLSLLLAVFRRYEIALLSLRTRPTTLEDVFLSLTGRALRDS